MVEECSELEYCEPEPDEDMLRERVRLCVSSSSEDSSAVAEAWGFLGVRGFDMR